MKRILDFVLLLMFALSSCAPTSLTHLLASPVSPVPPTAPLSSVSLLASAASRPLHALWVNDQLSTPAEIDTMLENVRRWGFDTILINVFCNGDNYVPGYFYNGVELPSRNLDFDPLTYLLEQAHYVSPRIQVFAWVCVAYQGALADWLRNTLGQDVRLWRLDYDDQDISSDFIFDSDAVDLHNPAYRQWIVGYFRHLVQKYDVDGITFDYIRVMEDCLSEACRAEWLALGYPLKYFDYSAIQEHPEYWQPFHQRVINDIVERVSFETRRIRPDIQIGAAVSDEWTIWDVAGGARSEGQDPVGWVQQGWVDYIWAMTYHNDYQEFITHVDEHRQQMSPTHLAECVVLYDQQDPSRPAAPEVVAPQVEYVLNNGLAGVCPFEYFYLQASPALQTWFTRIENSHLIYLPIIE